MLDQDKQKLVAQLKVDEGFVGHAYQDSLGYWTIGYGRLVDANKGGKITVDEGTYLLCNDVASKETELQAYDWYTSQDSVRQAALLNMAFNLGVPGLLKFPIFLGHMQAHEYELAAQALEPTKWHKQVGVRADRVIALIRTGQWP